MIYARDMHIYDNYIDNFRYKHQLEQDKNTNYLTWNGMDLEEKKFLIENKIQILTDNGGNNMGLPNSIGNLKDVGLYSYSVERNGDIELNFKISKSGNYKLIIDQNEIKRMSDTSKMMVKADKLGYFDK